MEANRSKLDELLDQAQLIRNSHQRKNEVLKNDAKSVVDAAMTGPMMLGSLDKDMLMHIVGELASRYKTADAERLDLKRLMADAQSTRRQLGEVLAQHQELEEAHVMQSKLFQKLQRKQNKFDAMEAKQAQTIKAQEQAIAKMEAFIESRLQKPDGSISNGVYDENERLEKANEHQVNEIYQLEKRIRELERELNQHVRRRAELAELGKNLGLLEGFREQVAEQEKQIQDLDAANSELGTTKAALEADVVRLNEIIQQMDTYKERLEQVKQELDTAMQALQTEVVQLIADREALQIANRELEASKKTLESENAQLTTDNQILDAGRTLADAENKKFEAANEELQSTKKTLEADNARLVAEKEQEKKAMEDEKDKLLGEKGQLETDKEELEAELRRLQEVKPPPPGDTEGVKEQMDKLTAAVGHLEGENRQLQTEVDALKTQIETKMSSDDAANRENVSDEQHRLQEIEADLKAKDIRIATLHMQLEKSAQEYANTIADLRIKMLEMEVGMQDVGGSGNAGSGRGGGGSGSGSGSGGGSGDGDGDGDGDDSNGAAALPSGNASRAVKALNQVDSAAGTQFSMEPTPP